MTVLNIAMAGGLFAIFTFNHFVIDWIFQTHAEAMAKHNDPWVRARHCGIYTVGFMPLMFLLHFSFWKFVIGLNILFWSHQIEDSYVPVVLWAKYFRRHPAMKSADVKTWFVQLLLKLVSRKSSEPAVDIKPQFMEFISTPLGTILMVVIDQLVHLAFLFPLIYMAIS